MKAPFKLKKIAEEQTVGKRTHLWVHTNARVKHYNLPGTATQPPMFDIPFQTYTFTLHPECTRGVYRRLKKEWKLDRRLLLRGPGPKRKTIAGFGSRKRARGQPYGPSGDSVRTVVDR